MELACRRRSPTREHHPSRSTNLSFRRQSLRLVVFRDGASLRTKLIVIQLCGYISAYPHYVQRRTKRQSDVPGGAGRIRACLAHDAPASDWGLVFIAIYRPSPSPEWMMGCRLAFGAVAVADRCRHFLLREREGFRELVEREVENRRLSFLAEGVRLRRSMCGPVEDGGDTFSARGGQVQVRLLPPSRKAMAGKARSAGVGV